MGGTRSLYYGSSKKIFMTPLSKQEVPIVKGSRKSVEFDPEKHRKFTDK